MGSGTEDKPLQTGYTCLDQLIGGLRSGELAVITGNLAVEFALNLVEQIGVRSERGVLLCSGGTSREEISERLLCCHAGIDSAMLSREDLDESAWAAIREAAGDLYDSPVLVEDVRDLSWMALRAKCRQVHSEFGIELLVLDLLLAGADRAAKLKALAGEFKVPVVVCGAAPGHGLGDDEVKSLGRQADLLLRVDSADDSARDERVVECVAEKNQTALGKCSLVFLTKPMRFEEQGQNV